METQANGSSQPEKVVHVRKAKTEFTFSPREGCVACSAGPKVFLFGGVIQSDHAEPQETNELLVFNTETESWQKVAASGSLPPPRAAASLVAVGLKLYLFGGLSHMTGWFDDLFVFDTENSTWKEVETEGNKPRPRDKLQGVAIGSNIYYFGGFGPKTAPEEMDEDWEDEEEEEEDGIPEAQEQEGAEFGWFNDLFVLDTVNLKWSQPLQMNLGVPTPRAAHGMCAIGSNLYIFGGRDFEDRQNDLHCFDVSTRKWNLELKSEGVVPQPRSFHTVCAAGGQVVVVGGRGRNNCHFADICLYDCEKGQWTQPRLEGVAMEARGQHVAVVVGKVVVVFGGTGEFSSETMQCQRFYTDTLLISTEELCGPVVNGNA
ncbi:kelch domain-containing protein 2-like [Babylonia areolata]|uniref:kelch domain-containing protein 2-like n=1 Tax=Babylonia areolata TaxID=304850 RepID=UPI003FD48076